MSGFETRADIPYTYRDYSLLPPDGRRWELVEGEFYVTPAPTSMHQTVSRRLQFQLMQQLELPGIAYVFDAPFDVLLADTTVVQPDLVVIKKERKHLITERGLEGVPNLIVEIVSPSTKGQDEFLKRSTYAKFGVAEYWLVHPDHGWVDVLGLEEGGYKQLGRRFDRASTLVSRELPEISIPLAPIFAPL